MPQSKLILIAGPTASGKSALAMSLARKTGGTIINADALQIYEGLPLLSAQPGKADQKEIPHELYGVLKPEDRSSVGHWLTLAQEAIGRAQKNGGTAILVGGTGLYFRALLGGLATIPSISDEIRREVSQLYDHLGEEKFRHALAEKDATSAARITKNDRQRLIRAYEVVRATGKSLPEWQAASPDKPTSQEKMPLPDVSSPDIHLLMPPREQLYEACERRFHHMIERGAIEEARIFLERKLDPDCPSMKTLGLRELGTFLSGKISRDEAILKACQATRNYAKRQLTWFRNQKLPGHHVVAPE